MQKQTKSLMASLGKRFTHPTNRCHIIKASDTLTGDVVGWCLVRWEDGTPTAASGSEATDFVAHYLQEQKKNWSELVARKSHVGKINEFGSTAETLMKATVIGALYVRPNRQGEGIGKSLVEYIDSKYDLDSERVLVQTRAISEGFYAKLSWVTASSTDIDLSEWGGEGMGYGVHRSPQMVRYPKSTGAEV